MHLEEIEYGREDSFSVSTYTSKPRQWRHLLERPFDKVTLLVTDDDQGKDPAHGEQSPTCTVVNNQVNPTPRLRYLTRWGRS
jgi:hypothetical protein